MSTTLSISAMLCTLVIAGIFAHDLLIRRQHIMSVRNVFLLGFVHFQCISAYLFANATYWDSRYTPNDQAMLMLSIALPVFLVIFMCANRIGLAAHWLTNAIPRLELPSTTPAVLVSAAALGAAALALAIIPASGFAGLLFTQFRAGLAAASVGLATYYLLAQRFNPMAWAVFIAALGAGVIATTVGGSGRRFVLGVFMAVAWMWFYAVLRHRGPVALLARFIPAAVAVIIALAAYDSVRQRGVGAAPGGVDAATRAQQIQELVATRSISDRAFERNLYTDTAGNTMFILETYPGNFEFMPLHGLYFIITNPVPRIFWPDKPEGLGHILREQMGTLANLGPGIIGHGWSEMGWLGVAYYAIFFGLVIGVLDRALRDRADNPFFVAIVGVVLGNGVGLARGDTALFVIQILAGVVSAGAVLLALKLAFGPVFAAFPRIAPPRGPRARSEYDLQDLSESYVNDPMVTEAEQWEHRPVHHDPN